MNIIRAIREEVFVPIHPAGWPFIIVFAVGYSANWLLCAIIFCCWRAFDFVVCIFFPQSSARDSARCRAG